MELPNKRDIVKLLGLSLLLFIAIAGPGFAEAQDKTTQERVAFLRDRSTENEFKGGQATLKCDLLSDKVQYGNEFYEAGIKDLEEAIRISPDNAPCYLSRAMFYETIIEAFDKARFGVYCKKEFYKRALADYQKAYALDPTQNLTAKIDSLKGVVSKIEAEDAAAEEKYKIPKNAGPAGPAPASGVSH